jgi:hypothetical protein
MPFKLLVVTQAMMLLLGVLTFLASLVKLTLDPFATNKLDFFQVTQINQQVTTPRHVSCHSACLPACHLYITLRRLDAAPS